MQAGIEDEREGERKRERGRERWGGVVKVQEKKK